VWGAVGWGAVGWGLCIFFLGWILVFFDRFLPPAATRAHGSRWQLHDDTLNKVLWEDALFESAGGAVGVFAVVPVRVFFLCHSDDLVGGEIEVVAMRRGVVKEGLDLERWGCRGVSHSLGGGQSTSGKGIRVMEEARE
jgi:hypothetical protein